jgi:hypothetical protein
LTRLIDRYSVFVLRHYDLVWYRAQTPPVEPNLALLQNALDQTQGEGAHQAAQWRDLVGVRARELDFTALRADVAPFLERPKEAELIDRDNVASLLRV